QSSFTIHRSSRKLQAVADLQIEKLSQRFVSVRCDLEVHVWERGRQIGISWLYNRGLFDGWRMEQMLRHYVGVVRRITGNPDAVIGGLELLEGEERRRILEDWNATTKEIPEATLPELFERQVERTPDAVAVVYEEQHLSYRELSRRANQLAR